MSFVIMKELPGRPPMVRYLSVDEWNGTSPIWIEDMDEATHFEQRNVDGVCKKYRGDCAVEVS